MAVLVHLIVHHVFGSAGAGSHGGVTVFGDLYDHKLSGVLYWGKKGFGMWGKRVRLFVSFEASEERPWALEDT